ncbi:hypothetical protein CN884_18515 [Ochrobactrum sp. 30A/1000/2015]|nr:hypothetical protein A4G21_01645 [Brucella intermedia]PJT19766.1 hypothetical protein CN884_18515 [Ochrobactrum sp. 30A/1000/2015]PJT40772.1 hypothetical protein CN883_04775 [Ochrobactrum sp. 27A/999/2015]PJT45144.1 hypothetical protein CN882_04840 [Ochrobactrum sp. 23A/997/2015]OAE46291.1 hypothetical protein A7J42_05740 [Brucella intermedia]
MAMLFPCIVLLLQVIRVTVRFLSMRSPGSVPFTPPAQDVSGITMGRTELQATTLDMDHFSQRSINVTTPLQPLAQVERTAPRIRR